MLRTVSKEEVAREKEEKGGGGGGEGGGEGDLVNILASAMLSRRGAVKGDGEEEEMEEWDEDEY